MAKVPASLVDRSIDVERASDEPLYAQLYEGLRQGIVDGRFPRGTRLPATRALADEIGVSRNTVIRAFDQLRSEGYLDSQVGSGTYVAEQLPERHTRVQGPPSESDYALHLSEKTLGPVHLSKRAERLMDCSLSLMDGPIQQTAFRPGVPDLDAFPIETWSRLASRRWRTLPTDRLRYGDPCGYLPLRKVVAEHLRTARGVQCKPEQVLIVSGVQQAFTLVSRLLLDPGDEVCVGDPGFPRMRAAFAAAGGTTCPIPVDHDGLLPSAIDSDSSPRMVGVTPSHQYPLGATMSLSRRLDLLEWAADNEVWILEDDYDSEFRYSGRAIASLQGMDRAGRVLYAGTFSKVLFPALRLGYLVVPFRFVSAAAKMRAISDRCPPRVSQMILADFIEEGHFGEHIRQMRTLYADRQAALTESLNDELGDFIELIPSDTGLHLVGRLPPTVDDRAVSKRLAEHNIVAHPLSFYAERSLDRGGLLLGYGGLPTDQIRHEVQRMADIVEHFRS